MALLNFNDSYSDILSFSSLYTISYVMHTFINTGATNVSSPVTSMGIIPANLDKMYIVTIIDPIYPTTIDDIGRSLINVQMIDPKADVANDEGLDYQTNIFSTPSDGMRFYLDQNDLESANWILFREWNSGDDKGLEFNLTLLFIE